MLEYLRTFNYQMAYSDTRIVLGGLAHVPVLISIVNFEKVKKKKKDKKKKKKNN